MSYIICTVAAAPLRSEASHRSEMTSQLLFGETAQVLEEQGDWLRIKGTYDGYEGWLTNHLIAFVEESTAKTPAHFVTTGLLNRLKFRNDVFQIPMGSSLTGYQEPTHLLWNEHYFYKGACRDVQQRYTKKLFQKTILPWLHVPYLWGGKTAMGVDCSGFVQVVFKVLGIPLRRDAYQQAEQGQAVADIKKAQEGDLAFFHNEAGKITHVGLVLPERKIIHAAGRVRMDHLTEAGIFTTDSNKQTHHLHSIRRVANFEAWMGLIRFNKRMDMSFWKSLSFPIQFRAGSFLVLNDMKNGVLFFLLFSLSCNQTDKAEPVLNQPPYRALTDSLQQQPQNAGLYYRRGVLLYQNEQLSFAKQDLEKAWQLEPTEEHALSVVTALIKTNADSAIRFIQQALQQLPKSVALQIGLARGYQQKGDLQKAVAACDQVLVLYPTSLDALLLKAEILKQQNNTVAALTTLEQAYYLAPFDAELCYNLAFAYAQAKNEKVISLTDSLIQADSTGKEAQPYYLKGVYYANVGNAPQAIQYFNQAIAHDYTFLDAHMDKGALLYEQKKFSNALTVFQLVNRISPTYADAYFWAGKCEEALQKNAEAKLDYQRAFGLDTSLHEAKAAAARL